ncbi:MAG TPA: hypothetical protein VKB79_23105 [Bryobacteraceae bacterium]|nr:hypothetical protein [Bryobacteraceae bacterium]
MAHRSIEEVISTIAPSRRRGIPNPPTLDVGISSQNGDLANSLSQAGQQIAQLQAAYAQQANLIAENTQALQSNTSAQSGHSAGSVLSQATSGLFGGALSFLSPIVSGIASLFGGGGQTPAALPIYTPPPPVSINAVLQSPTPSPVSLNPVLQSPAAPSISLAPLLRSPAPVAPPPVSIAPLLQQPAASPATQPSSAPTQSNSAANVTVNINAMDSQSFLDRSNDIANAVRCAMLNMHPINDVVTSL